MATHAAYLGHLMTSPLAEIRSQGGAHAVATGARSNVENGVIGDLLDPDAADKAVAELVRWLSVERRVPACWLCPVPPTPPDLPDRLRRAGCRSEHSGIEMGAELHRLPDTSAPPAGVELRPASGRLLDAAFDVYAACGWFEEPGDRERRTAIARTLRDGESACGARSHSGTTGPLAQ